MQKAQVENESTTTLRSLFLEALVKWDNDNALRMSAALAFYTVLSLSPLLVIALSVATPFFGTESARAEIVRQFSLLIGQDNAQFINWILQKPNRPIQGVLATTVSLATLAIGATGVFAQLQSAIDTIWSIKREEGRILSFLRQRFLSFLAVIGISFLLLLSLFLHAAIAAWLRYMDLYSGMHGTLMLRIINSFGSFLLMFLLFAMIFLTLPSVRLKWRDVWFSALITAILFSSGKFVFEVYLGKTGISSGFGAAGSLVAIMLWVYFSAIVLFYGAEFSAVYAKRRGSLRFRRRRLKKHETGVSLSPQ
ncbi:YihY/virulence factor BrkB family protein, partial [bacterium]|nr:YihY/virulence factor BrkB family protein [bacterium]